MNLHAKLLERETAGKPVPVGVIGAGKFGTMYLSQARLTAGTHVVAVADLDIARARSQLQTAGWPAELEQPARRREAPRSPSRSWRRPASLPRAWATSPRPARARSARR